MKGSRLITILIIIIIVAIAWFALSGTSTAPEEGVMEGDEAMMEDDSMMEGDAMMIDDAVVFNVTGKKFEFSMDEIRVKEGDTVTINFESTDGLHDWVVDEFDAATEQVNTGDSTSVTFVADKAGTYEYYCSVGNHRELGMVGTLIVE